MKFQKACPQKKQRRDWEPTYLMEKFADFYASTLISELLFVDLVDDENFYENKFQVRNVLKTLIAVRSFESISHHNYSYAIQNIHSGNFLNG